MQTVTRDDIVKHFPGVQDHAVVEILAMNPTAAELGAAASLLTSDDEDLIDIKRRENDRLNRPVQILDSAGIEMPDER